MAALTTVKKVKNAVLYNDAQGNPLIRIDCVRISFPHFGEPREEENDDGKMVKRWDGQFMLPKATHEAAKMLCEEVINGLIKKNEAKVPKDKWFISDGDDKEADEAQGHWLISAGDPKVRPKARDRKGEVMDDINKIDETFYGGCWGHVLIRPWFFGGKSKNSTKTYPKRVSAGLNAVVFFKDDKPFGSGRVDDSDAWDNAPVSEDSGMDDDDI